MMEFEGLKEVTDYRNMRQLIQLRWFAVLGQITTILVVSVGMKVTLPLPPMLNVLAALIAFNVACQLRWHHHKVVGRGELFFSLLFDVVILTMQLYFSGGVTNPFVFLYLLQIVLSAVLFSADLTLIVLALSILSVLVLAIFAQPLTTLFDNRLDFFNLNTQGILISFILNATLLVFFISRIQKNLRDRDAEISQFHQRASEEKHILRMALLTSGAAHELGTPLATLSVILGDWRRTPEFNNQPDIQEDIIEMEAQVKRCKSILTDILLSSGETRGESSVKTTVQEFFNQIIAEWQLTRRIVVFEYSNHIDQRLMVISDTAIKQMIFTVLNNALDASPNWIRLATFLQDGIIQIVITDAGPGFEAHVLAQFGQIYQSTKGHSGSGLGLFLAIKVATELGGTVQAQNMTEGGAQVSLKIPLSAIQVE